MQDDSNQDEVQEGEVVEEVTEPTSEETTESTPTVTTSASDSEATILESLESLIRENLAKIDRLGEELGKQKEMVDSVLLNDEVYKQHDEAAKAAAKVKNNTKQQIMSRPDVSHIANKLKEASLEIKETKESMNSYLQEYQRLSGSSEIEDDKGQVMQIISIAKLVRRR